MKIILAGKLKSQQGAFRNYDIATKSTRIRDMTLKNAFYQRSV